MSSIHGLAEALVQARRGDRTLDSAAWADALPDAAAAYRVQDAVAERLGWFDGERMLAWKSGGASREAVLTHAALPPSGVRYGPASFDDLAFHTPGIEAEIALRLAVDVTPERAMTLTHDDASGLIDALTVAIEIVDSRWKQGPRAPALLRLADVQSHGGLALGGWIPVLARDWSAQRVTVQIAGRDPCVFAGSHALGDPAWLLPTWLRHATRHGATALAGTIVTTGTWCGVLAAEAGDRVVVSFDGIGEVEARI